MQAFVRDEEGTATAMWRPVAKVIDWAVFYGARPRGRTDEDEAKLDAVRFMINMKFVFECGLYPPLHRRRHCWLHYRRHRLRRGRPEQGEHTTASFRSTLTIYRSRD
jgi:hypothetical protein